MVYTCTYRLYIAEYLAGWRGFIAVQKGIELEAACHIFIYPLMENITTYHNSGMQVQLKHPSAPTEVYSYTYAPLIPPNLPFMVT